MNNIITLLIAISSIALVILLAFGVWAVVPRKAKQKLNELFFSEV